MRRYFFELFTIIVCSVAILHGTVIYLADIGRPPVAYSETERQQLNWLVMHSTRKINGKFQGRLGE